MLAAALFLPFAAGTQDAGPRQAIPPAGAAGGAAPSRVEGEIIRVTASGDQPVPRQWVVLHGIGASGGRAIDSVLTAADGSFVIRYDRGADSTAQYFVTTVHHGIAYVSGVLPPEATANEATLSVFDTTSAPVPIAVRGRHIIVFAPTDNPRRRVAEIYDLSNDSTLTRVGARGGEPLWTANVPAGAEEFASGPEMLSNESIALDNGRVVARDPIAPGLKRIAFTYALPATAFPISIPLERPTDVFEILVEDRGAEVAGPGLEETAPSTIEGRTFRRFQGRSMPSSAVVTVRMPAAPVAPRRTNPFIIAALAALMIGALAIALRRARTPAARSLPMPAPQPQGDSEGDALAREIAALDADFERRAPQDDGARVRYRDERARLKQRLAERLAARRRP